MSYRPLVEKLVSDVVAKPEDVEIEEYVEGGVRTFSVTVAPEDMGKVIGKAGKVIQSIRTVVSAVAAKNREKAYVKVPD